MKKDTGNNLSLKTETVRPLSADEMKNISGGMPSYCWTVIVPSSGLTTTIAFTLKKC